MEDSAIDEPDLLEAAPSKRGLRSQGLRSASDRYVAGVFGGLGERLDVDAGLLRIAAVAVAVAMRSNIGLLVPALYALVWVSTAPTGERAPLTQLRIPSGRRDVAAAAACGLLGVVALANASGWPAAALAAVAWFLLAERPATEVAPVEPPSMPRRPVADPPPADVPIAAPGEPSDSATESAARWGRARRGVSRPLPVFRLPRLKAARVDRREPALWPLTLALLLGFTVVCATVDNVTDPGLDPSIWVNGAFVIVGGVLALSGWRGRAGWTALLALPLAPLWLAFSASDIGRFEGEGSSALDIVANDRDVWEVDHGYGSQRIRVSADALDPDRPVRIEAGATAGTIDLSLPANADLVVRTTVGLGGGSLSSWSEWTDWFQAGSTSRTVTRPAEAPVCETLVYQPATFASLWQDSGWSGSVPDFADPGAFDGDDAATRFALSYVGVPEVPVPVLAPSGEVEEWVTAFDPMTSQPCDPDADFTSAGTIEIDATVGLGSINVNRTN